MNFKSIKEGVKKSWKWIWNSDSILSWIVALILIYVFIKILFMVVGILFATSLPIAGVESSSMDHQIAKDDSGILTLCEKVYNLENKEHINFNEYWDSCGDWYEQRNISKGIFSEFPLHNGFRKGDVIIIWGRFNPKLGDIIVFKPNSGSAPRPIIHRIISINEDGTYQTKGDHNGRQLVPSNNIYKTDETNIPQENIIGKAIFKIPYMGWPKIWLTELINIFR